MKIPRTSVEFALIHQCLCFELKQNPKYQVKNCHIIKCYPAKLLFFMLITKTQLQWNCRKFCSLLVLDELICHLWHSQWFFWMSMLISIWNLVLIAFERFLAVCKPLKHQDLTGKNTMILKFLIWLTFWTLYMAHVCNFQFKCLAPEETLTHTFVKFDKLVQKFYH